MELRHVADLCLDAPEFGRAHLTAASGLVRRGERLYVASDEEFGIAVFDDRGSAPGRLVPLTEEPLPADPARRKATKPDIEVLTELEPAEGWPAGALLALGSGATDRRERGWLWPLDGDELAGAPAEISLADLYAQLREELADLNVEGAAACGDALWLAQRGNGADGANALVELSLADALEAVVADRVLPRSALRSLRTFELGEDDGVALTFTDLAPLPDGRLVFCAVAEAGDSTYYDGPCVGAAVGALDPRGSEVLASDPLPQPHKVEGVAPLRAEGGRADLLLVADPDDPAIPAPLFEARAALG